MNVEENSNERLIQFLKRLVTSLETQQVAPKQLRAISEFFMSYQFQSQLENDAEDSEDDEEYSHENLIKFLTLGWYIYVHILRKNNTLIQT